jgi:hypothetical protein
MATHIRSADWNLAPAHHVEAAGTRFAYRRASRRAAKAFLARLKERTRDRDKAISLQAFLRQLKAIKAWGQTGAAAAGHHPQACARGQRRS